MTPQVSNAERKKTADDFIFGKVLGEGSFSTVYLGKEVETGREFAIKVLQKRHILKEKKLEYVNREKKALLRLCNDPNIKYFIHLHATFQDPERLYFVLTYARNGELLQHILKHKCFRLEVVKYYAAELTIALEFLKLNRIIHRDLKPENVLFDKDWHILITDFGSAKLVDDDTTETSKDGTVRRKNSFVGTAEYVSPEILSAKTSTYASDLWAFGCIIYQMISGQAPFKAPSEYLIFQKILKLEFEFSQHFDEDAKDLINKLIILEADNRLGATDTIPYTSIRDHQFFKEILWDDLGPPPKLSEGCDNESQRIVIPDHLEPGLDGEKASKLHLDMLAPSSEFELEPTEKESEPLKLILNLPELTDVEIKERLELQKDDPYNEFVEGNVILKKGFLEKRKGLFARKRMFLLTTGPHLYYVEPTAMVLKGQIPFSEDLRTEAKNFKVFYIHTPNRTYYLEDLEGYALEWCKVIDEVVSHYYPKKT